MVLFLNKILFLVGISSSSCSPSSLKSCFSSSILLPPNILLTRLPGNYVLTSASIASKDSPFCFLFSLSPLPLSTCQISLSTFFFFFHSSRLFSCDTIEYVLYFNVSPPFPKICRYSPIEYSKTLSLIFSEGIV